MNWFDCPIVTWLEKTAVYLFRHIRFGIVFTIAVIGLAILVLANSAVYFQSAVTPAFFVEKLPISDDSLWRTAFYFHIVAASVCFVTGFPLFFPALLRFRRVHFVLGYVYFNAVLWIAAPTGLMMSPFAKGGLLAAIGFAITGVAWWWTTWCGYKSIRRGDVQTHIRWMVRSFSIALSAVFFRVIQIGLGWIDVAPESNYIASIWLSLLASVCLAESCIASKRLATRPLTKRSVVRTVVVS